MIRSIVVCNTTGSASTFSIYLDDDGTTYDGTTQLFNDVDIAAGETIIIEGVFGMDDDTGNLAVQAGDADAVCFTVFGTEQS